MSVVSEQEVADATPEAVAGNSGAQRIFESDVVSRQFVIFHVGKEVFAVRLSAVQEIIRMPNVVKVPMSPPALEGLANLRGSVLPVLNLREIFSFPVALHDDSTRVVVLDHGRPIGLVVDRMSNVVTVDQDRIEPVSNMGAAIDTGLLTGMIKSDRGQGMVMILDTAKTVEREFRGAIQSAADRMSQGGHEGREERKSSLAAALDEDHLVSFEVADQEYAFPIERVEEIIQLPDQITQLPNSHGHVLGVITLRNRLLPLVSLRTMFGLPSIKMSDANKVVVITVGEGVSVGVVMDGVKEVLRVARTIVDPMPALLSQGQAMNDIESICRLQDGKRLVSVLSAERMFKIDEIRKAVSDVEKDEDMAKSDAAAYGAEMEEEEQFVVFRLMEEEYGVPIEAVQEIVRVPDELTRIPKTPEFIEGVVNLRGVVLPVLDQRTRFGLPSTDRNDRQRIMVFTINGVRTGFIVDSVSEVMRIGMRQVGPAPALSARQQRLINRVANLEEQKRMILLLEVKQLLNFNELDELKMVA
jgi:purine-binding chemotaxis protein CheW